MTCTEKMETLLEASDAKLQPALAGIRKAMMYLVEGKEDLAWMVLWNTLDEIGEAS